MRKRKKGKKKKGSRRAWGGGIPWQRLKMLLDSGDSEAALELADELYGSGARDPRFLELRAMLLAECGRGEEGLALYARLSSAGLLSAAGLYNMGRTAQRLGRYQDAQKAYSTLLGLDPSFHLAWNNMGLLLLQTGRGGEAVPMFVKSVELAPGFAEGWNNLGVALDELGRSEEAEAAFRKALELSDGYVSPLFNLAHLCQRTERYGEAEALLVRLLEVDPAHDEARFMLAALRGEAVQRPPASYVKRLFDQAASRFDAILTGELEYKTPSALYRLISSCVRVQGEILDAGCGTGLGAEFYRPHASLLVGGDISLNMLRQAGEKGLYDLLVCFDLLGQWPFTAAFDLIYASDVLVYCGDLALALGNFRRGLKHGGVVGFSVELLSNAREGQRLQPSGRYAHSREYVDKAVKESHLEMVACERTVLRKEGGDEVAGLLAVARAS